MSLTINQAVQRHLDIDAKIKALTTEKKALKEAIVSEMEATKINLSLSTLCHVISALTDSKSTYVPYRDSKLTRLLMDSLGGNTKTLMISNVGPADYNYDETMNTIRYASRAKNIKNKPKNNEDPKDALLREYQDEITKLKDQLSMLNSGADPAEFMK